MLAEYVDQTADGGLVDAIQLGDDLLRNVQAQVHQHNHDACLGSGYAAAAVRDDALVMQRGCMFDKAG